MNRRGFLKGLLAAAAVQAFDIPLLNQVVDDPERLLWVPGQKTYFLPPDTGHYYLVTVETITREALRVLQKQLALGGALNRRYDEQFSLQGTKIGDTVKLEVPSLDHWLEHSRLVEVPPSHYPPNAITTPVTKTWRVKTRE